MCYDVLLALLLALGATTTSLLYQRIGIYQSIAPVWLWVLGLALCTLPIAFRRRFPVPVAAVVSIGFFVCGQFGVPETLIVNICLFIALYTVGAWEPNRALAIWSLIVIALVMCVWLIIWLIVSSSDTSMYPGLSRSGLFSAYATFAVLQIITNLCYFTGAIFFGTNSWKAARNRAVLEAQGRELDAERRTSAAQAVALDRLAIARELHDVVAHHVSVMGLQAAAARMSLDAHPETAKGSLEVIEQSAHTAVNELRSLVHTLRTPDIAEPGSTVGVARIPELIEEAQLAGTQATFVVAGSPRALPILVDVALYRVAQEALTNVRKHAGHGATAEVRLRFTAAGVELEVTDNGVRQKLGDRPNDPLGGMGLRGMRERLGAVGGHLESGPREGSQNVTSGANAPATATGFLVRATVPLSKETA